MLSLLPRNRKTKNSTDPLDLIARWLSRSDRTRSELRGRLVALGVTESDADEALEMAAERGWLNEERLAERIVETGEQRQLRGRGMTRIHMQRRGIDEDVVEAIAPEQDESEIERALAWLRSQKPLSASAVARKLAARGFGEETIRQVLDQTHPGWDEEV